MRSAKLGFVLCTVALIPAACETGMNPGGPNTDAIRAQINQTARRVVLSIITALEQGDPDAPGGRSRKVDLRSKMVDCPLGGMRDIQDDGSVAFDGCTFFPGLSFSGQAGIIPGDNEDSFSLNFTNFTTSSGNDEGTTVEGSLDVITDDQGNTTYRANMAILSTSDGETFRQAIKSDLKIALDGTVTGFMEVGISEVGFEDFDSDPTRCEMTGLNLFDVLNDPETFNETLSQACNEDDIEFIDPDDPDDALPQTGDLAVLGTVETAVKNGSPMPVANVDIIVVDPQNFLPLGSATSGADGRYVVGGLAEGQEVIVIASKDGYAIHRSCRTILRNRFGGFEEEGTPVTSRIVKANNQCQTDVDKFDLTIGSAPGLAQSSPITNSADICDRATTHDPDAVLICLTGDAAAPTISWMDDWDMDGTAETVTKVRVTKDGSPIFDIENAAGIASPVDYGDTSAGTVQNGDDGSTPLETGRFYEVILTSDLVGRLTFEIAP